MTTYEKMLMGEVYNAIDDELLEALNACKDLCWEYNQIRPTHIEERNKKLQEILWQSRQGYQGSGIKVARFITA